MMTTVAFRPVAGIKIPVSNPAISRFPQGNSGDAAVRFSGGAPSGGGGKPTVTVEIVPKWKVAMVFGVVFVFGVAFYHTFFEHREGLQGHVDSPPPDSKGLTPRVEGDSSRSKPAVHKPHVEVPIHIITPESVGLRMLSASEQAEISSWPGGDVPTSVKNKLLPHFLENPYFYVYNNPSRVADRKSSYFLIYNGRAYLPFIPAGIDLTDKQQLRSIFNKHLVFDEAGGLFLNPQ